MKYDKPRRSDRDLGGDLPSQRPAQQNFWERLTGSPVKRRQQRDDESNGNSGTQKQAGH